MCPSEIKCCLIFGCIFLLQINTWSQCCSGGGASPIAGGGSQGVLAGGQVELNLNYQNLNSERFLSGDTATPNYLEHFYSQYLYLRAGYGITSNLTFSVESGYYLNKTQFGLEFSDTSASSGIGDLVLFPRYCVLNKTSEKKVRSEITVGLGYKIPIGMYNDSVNYFTHPVSGKEYYMRKPPGVQPTTGSQDVIFYLFYLRDYTCKNIKFFANALYIRKGWNPDGEKFGDYCSVGLFASRNIKRNIGLTLQLKYEWIDWMQRNRDLPFPNYDPKSSGSRKVFVVPQLSYTWKKQLTFYCLSEFPVYQYVNGTQIGSQYQTTAGISWRFQIKKPSDEVVSE